MNPPVLFPSSRSLALLGLVICTALLGAAVKLTPDPRGHGSHEQLGLPPCGMMVTSGWPCPTCGMCTAFALGVRGRLIASFVVQPAGFLLFVVTAAGGAMFLFVVLTGKSVRLPLPRWSPARWTATVAIVCLLAWGYKILVTLGFAASP